MWLYTDYGLHDISYSWSTRMLLSQKPSLKLQTHHVTMFLLLIHRCFFTEVVDPPLWQHQLLLWHGEVWQWALRARQNKDGGCMFHNHFFGNVFEKYFLHLRTSPSAFWRTGGGTRPWGCLHTSVDSPHFTQNGQDVMKDDSYHK